MEIDNRAIDKVDIIDLNGRFDAYESPNFSEFVETMVQSNRVFLVINLNDVSFIDSAALASLVKGMKRCREQQGDLVLCNLQKPTKTVFELTRLDKAFKIFDEETMAVSGFLG